MNIEPKWEECGDIDPAARLYAAITVCGCNLHLEAREVAKTEDGFQTFAEFPEDYAALANLYSVDWPTAFQTFQRDGRTYIAFAIPFAV